MSDLITIRLSPFEALILGTMIKAASEELTAQMDMLDQDQRLFVECIQKIGKQLPEVPA